MKPGEKYGADVSDARVAHPTRGRPADVEIRQLPEPAARDRPGSVFAGLRFTSSLPLAMLAYRAWNDHALGGATLAIVAASVFTGALDRILDRDLPRVSPRWFCAGAVLGLAIGAYFLVRYGL